MEDIILEFIGFILEVLLEVFFDFLIAALADAILRFLGGLFAQSETHNSRLASIGYLLFGLAFGGLSLIFFPHRLAHPSKFHGASLIISPIIVGALLSWAGAILRKREKKTMRIESFSYGFVFAFGVALARFLLRNDSRLASAASSLSRPADHLWVALTYQGGSFTKPQNLVRNLHRFHGCFHVMHSHHVRAL